MVLVGMIVCGLIAGNAKWGEELLHCSLAFVFVVVVVVVALVGHLLTLGGQRNCEATKRCPDLYRTLFSFLHLGSKWENPKGSDFHCFKSTGEMGLHYF